MKRIFMHNLRMEKKNCRQNKQRKIIYNIYRFNWNKTVIKRNVVTVNGVQILSGWVARAGALYPRLLIAVSHKWLWLYVYTFGALTWYGWGQYVLKHAASVLFKNSHQRLLHTSLWYHQLCMFFNKQINRILHFHSNH